jgi:hypothetical protein
VATVPMVWWGRILSHSADDRPYLGTQEPPCVSRVFVSDLRVRLEAVEITTKQNSGRTFLGHVFDVQHHDPRRSRKMQGGAAFLSHRQLPSFHQRHDFGRHFRIGLLQPLGICTLTAIIALHRTGLTIDSFPQSRQLIECLIKSSGNMQARFQARPYDTLLGGLLIIRLPSLRIQTRYLLRIT